MSTPIPAHLRERFFQRYFRELTAQDLTEMVGLATASKTREPDAFLPARERVWIRWNGELIGLAWTRRTKHIVTFLPAHARPGQKVPKTGAPRR